MPRRHLPHAAQGRALKASRPTPPPIRRCERAHPGELIHIDIKNLGRFERVGHHITGDRTGQSTRRSSKRGGTGWEFVHVCIDDASRVAFSQIKPDEKTRSAIAFLKAAIAYYKSLGVKGDPHHDRQRWLLYIASLRQSL